MRESAIVMMYMYILVHCSRGGYLQCTKFGLSLRPSIPNSITSKLLSFSVVINEHTVSNAELLIECLHFWRYSLVRILCAARLFQFVTRFHQTSVNTVRQEPTWSSMGQQWPNSLEIQQPSRSKRQEVSRLDSCNTILQPQQSEMKSKPERF
jgi:hypothetical protein